MARNPNARSKSEVHAALRKALSGGDRRSIAGSARAKPIVENNPQSVAALAALTDDPDWLVSMRAMDLLEKLAHEHPDWVQPHKAVFIGRLADSDKWEVRLQIVRALPLLEWTASERRRVIAILERDLDHPQKFVKAWALDSLATLSRTLPALSSLVNRQLTEFARSGSKALETRARLIRERLRTRSSGRNRGRTG